MLFNIETLGCKVNSYESAFIEEKMLEAGYTKTSDNSFANVIIINTCSVTNQADAKSRKIIRAARRANKNAIIVVCGCAAQNHKEVLVDLDIDILIGSKDKSKIVNLINDYKNNLGKIVKFYDLRNIDFEDMTINNFGNHTRGFVKIQDGCNNFCAYCIIPFTRGNIRSKDFDVAVKEVECLVNNGYQEIVLTGIHTGSYGSGTKYDLTDLIHEISKFDKLKRIRISSIEITELSPKFMEELKNNKKIVDHMHIPIQSGSNNVLKNMNRKYNVDEFIKIINDLRKIRPNINITTDLIVGFPESTNDDHLETLETLKTIGFGKIHTFPYSIRKNTKASTMKQVQDSIKKEREKDVLALSDKMEKEYYTKFIGQKMLVLVEEKNSGFTENYIKVILDKEVTPNTFVEVEIKSINDHSANGIIL